MSISKSSGAGTARGWCLILSMALAAFTGPGDQPLRSLLTAAPQVAPPVEDTAEFHHQSGVAYHLRRCLDDASREYARALELDPPRDLTPDEQKAVRRFAPRLYVTPSEFFTLKDFAVILHPHDRLIAYHCFWEDDIDFPEDNDPCDHELMWVQYSADQNSIEKIWTYFHGRILEGGPPALLEARQNGMRPRVNVQWGKHGSMPVGWEELKIVADRNDAEYAYYPIDEPISLKRYNEGTYKKLSAEGRRRSDHPLGLRLGWPKKFSGSWEDFVNFSRAIEPIEKLERNGMAQVSRWNSATINQYFLAYNFRPKTEWPGDPGQATSGQARDPFSAQSLEDFHLPAKSTLDPAMPRYPNVWFYVDAALATSYPEAVRLVTENLRAAMRLPEFYGPFSNSEGCDFEVRLEHLQPWEDSAHRSLQHSHAFHMRYYYSVLARQKLERVSIMGPRGERTFFRLAASAHYEVEHTNPNHADVEVCPYCGRTGEYREVKGNLVEQVHDPLGLELLLTGKVRGEIVRFEDWEKESVGGVSGLKGSFDIHKAVFPGQTGDRNTSRIGIILLTPK